MNCLAKNLREMMKAISGRGFDKVLEKVLQQGLQTLPSGVCAVSHRKPATLPNSVSHKYVKVSFSDISRSLCFCAVTLVSATPGKLVCEMKVEDDHANKYGTLHGGMTATLVDNISTLALVSVEGGAPGVSVDMNITYMSPAKIGEEIVITAYVLKQGKTLAFTSVDVTKKATGKLVAQGRHTKHVGSPEYQTITKIPDSKH